jgi:leucyl-tRNA synthetase
MNDRRKPYPFDQIEPKWQATWAAAGSFHAPNPGEPGFDPERPKFYVLDMFPYPSGAGLHVGHPLGYIATDIMARYKRMRGFNVLHPMGWDAFGLPAEQYAIKTGQHPRITTGQNVAKFKKQLEIIGLGYDWQREVNTTDPGYFRWTQWIFLQLYGSWFNPDTQRAEPMATYTGPEPDSVRLAYVSEAPVNWCPALGTVLANEEVIDGRSEVGGHPVERRPMRQWMLRITAFAQRLIDELEGLDWPEGIKLLQKNWIGRSEGVAVEFQVAGSEEMLRVFTTRPDTLFGVTYMVIAPEHRLVEQITSEDQWPEVRAYRERTARKSDLERTELAKEKTGVFSGAFAVNPVNGERIPVWVADYVLPGYGTGAIMAVPAHDERDFEFAEKFHLPIRTVVTPELPLAGAGESPCSAPPLTAFCDDGFAVNSPLIDGLPTAEAKQKISAWLEEQGVGKRTIHYKLRDWLFSRQRYWGEPFPVVWENGRHRALAETELPVTPPPLEDFKPTGTGEPPLARATEWIRYSETATRETNTMPQWAGSCWYYLRYCDAHNGGRFVGADAERYWMAGVAPDRESAANPQKGGVDLYVGGTEHAVLHLLYARFWHKVLFDLGHVSTPEPFQRLVNQGMMLGEDGQKMSKSRGNVINPDDVIAEYGADAFRCYEMFMGPLEQMKPWSTTGVEGVSRFLARVWRLVMDEQQDGSWEVGAGCADVPPDKSQLRVIHATIKKVGEDIEALSFNTAIAQMMIFVNAFTGVNPRPVSALRTLLVLLNPFAPHLTAELWELLSEKFPGVEPDIASQTWPAFDESLLIEDEVEMPVQVNGKVRDRLVMPKTAAAAEVEKAALASGKVQEHIAGRAVRKVIVVPGKLVNIVAA